MADLVTVAGGLLVAMLVVGGIVYLVLGDSIDFEWGGKDKTRE